MSTTVAPALKALLEASIDYAGIFPPAALTIDVAVENYRKYHGGEHSWLLRWFVAGAKELDALPTTLDGRLSLLSEEDHARAASIESKNIVTADRPVYCEMASAKISELSAIKNSGCFSKIRTGGLIPDAIPTPQHVADFIIGCAKLKLPFKATAGLHHAIRAEHPLTYKSDAPRAVMHGFLNVFVASMFAWQGDYDILGIIEETDASAFVFDDSIHWRSKAVSSEHIREAREKFLHSFGSCSFDEPVDELHNLGLI